jgi:hypothetical protein
VGWLTVRRRRPTAGGIHPVGPVPHPCEWFDIYGAVAPTIGERVCLEWPDLHAATFQLCGDAFAPAFPNSVNLLLRDNSGAYTAQRIRWPETIRDVWLPPYGPALNPIERVWRDLKDDLAWPQCTTLDAQPDQVGQLLQADDAPTLQSLTGYAYLVEAINALAS